MARVTLNTTGGSSGGGSTVPYGEEAIQSAELEPWPNPNPERDYVIDITAPEFTCHCPRSGYPDFATIRVRYVPDRSIVELRSFKLYLNAYRDRAIAHEAAANRILDDMVELLAPRWMELTADFAPRGNVHTVITVRHLSESWRPTAAVPLADATIDASGLRD
jgi:7-cyano-7-deazaguanine reductase